MTAMLETGQLVETTGPQEQRAIKELGEAIARSGPDHVGYLVAAGREPIALPHALYEVLVRSAQLLARGGAIGVLPADRMLTTQEAADLLYLSRTYLVHLLDEGRIPFQRVGRHRRIALADVMAYDAVRRQERRQHLCNLIELNERYGLYEKDAKAAEYFASLSDAERSSE